MIYIAPKSRGESGCIHGEGKGTTICIAPHRENLTHEALSYGSHSFTPQTHHTSHYLVSVHQTAPPLTSISSRLLAAYYSFIDPVRMKG